MKSAGKARNNGLYRHIRTSKEIIRNLLNDCKEHSNKCLNCGKYIDEDAMYCMDCLSGDTTDTNDSGTYTGDSVPDDGCQYKYSNGSVCGAKTNKYDDLCDKHFEELYDIYDSLLG